MGKYIKEIVSKAWKGSWDKVGGIMQLILNILVIGVLFSLGKLQIKGFWKNDDVIVVMILLFVFFVIFITNLMWEARSVYPHIKFQPIERTDPNSNKIKIAYLVIDYQEPIEITDCYATLEVAKQLYLQSHIKGDVLVEADASRSGRLEWDEGYGKDNCEIHFANGKRELIVASFKNGLVFSYCSGAREPVGAGLFLIKIRVDGKVRGRNIYPRFFEGYIYANIDTYIYNSIENRSKTVADGTIGKEEIKDNVPFNIPILVFNSGDWRKDKRIPVEIRKREVIWEKLNSMKDIF